RFLGCPRRGSEREDEPRGADRGRLGGLLRDGAVARARAGRHAAGVARHVGHRHVPAGGGDREGRADGHRIRARRRCRRLPGRGADGGGELPGLEGALGGSRGHPRRIAAVGFFTLAGPMSTLDGLITELERSYTETQERLSDPAVYNDHREAADTGRRLKELERPYRLAQEWRARPAAPHAARGGGGPPPPAPPPAAGGPRPAGGRGL